MIPAYPPENSRVMDEAYTATLIGKREGPNSPTGQRLEVQRADKPSSN